MLDDVKKMKKLDTRHVISATELLYKQCIDTYKNISSYDVRVDKKIQNVLALGMGGSHLGADLIMSVFERDIKVPMAIVSDYNVPGHVDEHTLVLATSYSGNTEEVLECVELCRQRGANILVLTTGGNLEQYAKQHNLALYTFTSDHNPSGIPRYGSGYLFISQLMMLVKAGVIDVSEQDIMSAINAIKKASKQYGIDVPEKSNKAKQMARMLEKSIVILVASEHLNGSAYIFKNQINESAKQLSTLFHIPELNHHMLEGLEHPEENKDILQFVFIESHLYHARNQYRYNITRDIIAKQGIQETSFSPVSNTKITQAYETVAFTSYVGLYLSMLHQIDPGPNPWVDYLKNELKKFS